MEVNIGEDEKRERSINGEELDGIKTNVMQEAARQAEALEALSEVKLTDT